MISELDRMNFELKQCKKCLEVKPRCEFYREKSRDGRRTICKKCSSEASKRWALNNIERTWSNNRNYRENHKKERLVAGAEWRRSHPLYSKSYRRWMKENKPDVYRAYIKLSYAVRWRKIIKPLTCNSCGLERKLEAHHDDYLKPLDVVWLCSECHKKKHSEENYEHSLQIAFI